MGDLVPCSHDGPLQSFFAVKLPPTLVNLLDKDGPEVLYGVQIRRPRRPVINPAAFAVKEGLC